VEEAQELPAQLPALLRPGLGVDEHQDGPDAGRDRACADPSRTASHQNHAADMVNGEASLQ